MSSPSDLAPTEAAPVELGRVLDELSNAVAAMERGAPAQLNTAQLSAAVGSIARLYGTCAQRAGRTDLISSHDVPTTEAVTLIAGLMAAQNLNTFDLALWLSRAQTAATITEGSNT